MQDFVILWIGKKYLLTNFVLWVLVINHYQKLMRHSYSVFKDSAGIWKEDRFVPLIESALNIIFSLILLKIFGLAGVFMGTIISGLALWCYSYPKFVYKKLFNRNYLKYAKETIGYILTFICIAIICYEFCNLITISNIFIKLILKLLISTVISNVLLILLFHKTNEFKYFVNLAKKLLLRNRKVENNN